MTIHYFIFETPGVKHHTYRTFDPVDVSFVLPLPPLPFSVNSACFSLDLLFVQLYNLYRSSSVGFVWVVIFPAFDYGTGPLWKHLVGHTSDLFVPLSGHNCCSRGSVHAELPAGLAHQSYDCLRCLSEINHSS